MGEETPIAAASRPSQDTKCELQTWHTRTNAEGEATKVLVENTAEGSTEEDVYALVLNRTFDSTHRLTDVGLTINSEHILKALRDTVKRHPTVPSDFSTPIEIKAPFQVLIHHWDDVHQHAEDIEDDTARMHLNLLIEFMDAELALDRKRYDAQHRSGSCEYSTLWTVFKPGVTVVNFVKGHPWLLKVVKAAYEETNILGKYVEVHCTFTDHNGKHSGDAKHKFMIRQREYFSQEDPADITNLPVYPRHFHKVDDKELEEKLKKRGAQYMELSQAPQVYNYDGAAQFLQPPPPSFWDPDQGEDPKVWTAYHETGRIILDRRTYGEEHVAPNVDLRHNLTPEDLMLCPPFIYGYSCSRKGWCRFFVPDIHETKWKPEPFENLVLPEEQKYLVKALVSSHQFPDNSRDQSLQKGKGLVCLLHGPPGAGKTLTAECAAEQTHKALFSCSMSELNEYNSPWWFEQELVRVLRLATFWKAIVLLDEADVFLEARQDDSTGNTERNALVAVFLRHLEYFSGIIFLTTNRIHVFDAAMKSRIHLALGFQPPDQKSRRKIWEYQLTKLPEGVLDADVEELLSLVEAEPINGREIANCVLTAGTLARYGNEALQIKHIKTVLGVRNDFEISLKRMRKATIASEPSAKQKGSYAIRQNSVLSEGISEEPDEI